MVKRVGFPILLLLSFCLSTPLFADGFIIPHPPRPEIKIPPLSVKYHRVQTVIDNQVAVTKVSQAFLNDYDRDLEGTYFFPLPEEAAISRFSMWSDGKLLEGKILGKDEARRIYEDIVRQLRDPAILEYVGRNLFKARVFPIPARGEKEISLEYSQMVRCEGGVCQYRYPLNTEKFSARPLQEVTLSVTISSKVPIKAVYSPTHDVKVVRKGDRTLTASFEKSNIKPDTDFILYYTLTEKEFGANLLTHKDNGEPGYFLLFVAPRSTTRKEEILAKDVVFVLDTSGSMEEEDRLTHAKKALRFCLSNLGEDDRFNVISFSSEVETFRKSLVASSEQNRLKAKQFVSDLKPGGGTNIQEALLTAILQLEPNQSRPRYVVFLTDGQPTVGVTRPEDIKENVKKAAKGVRIFTFGVGSDVNALLLDRLAEENRGVPEYMRPGEEMETKLASFSAKISHPALADLNLDFGKVEVSQMYPRSITDLFWGSQVTLVGKYKTSGKTALILKGKRGHKEEVHEYPVLFPERDSDHEFIPRLWATRRVGYLLDEVRTHGEDKELVSEIIELSRKYGIITPYTSFLVEEPKKTDHGARPRGGDEEGNILRSTLPKGYSGESAVETSKDIQQYKQQEGLYQPSPPSPEMARAQEKMKQAGKRTFYQQGEFWVQAEYNQEQVVTVKFGSKEYFDFLKDEEASKSLSVSPQVIFQHKGKWIKIVQHDEGK